jgi:uncharacterized membrane protein YfcA
MLNSIAVSLAVGGVLGFLTGLGTGGGSLLLLWLTLVLGMDPALARTVNLMFFIPAAVIASVIRFFKGGIPIKKIWLPATAGCLSAAGFAVLGSHMDTVYLQKFFGILLLFTGIKELFYRQRKPR